MAVAALVVALAGPFGDGGEDGTRPAEAGSRFGADRPGVPREKVLADALTPVIGEREAARAAALPVEEALAQLFVVGFDASAPGAIARETGARGWGALLAGGGPRVDPKRLRRTAEAAGRAARKAQRFEPLVVSSPELLGELAPPLGADLAAASPEEVRGVFEEAGEEIREAGVRMLLGPSADLAVGGGPAELRAFGEDPVLAGPLVRAGVDGLTDADVLAAPGRFPGEGAASQDPLEGPATVGLSLDELLARDVRVFAAVAERAPAIQMSAALYAAWDGVTPATLLPEAVAVLRDRLKFRGALLSADLVAVTAATGGTLANAAVSALRAGCDLIVVPGSRADRDAAYRGAVAAVRSGDLARERVDEALLRVLSLKQRVGLAGT